MPRISDPALLAQLETSQSSINGGGGGGGRSGGNSTPPGSDLLGGNARNAALQKVASLNALRRQAVIAAQMYNKNFSRESGRSSVAEFMPALMNDTNAQYDAAIDGLNPLARAAFRVPGSGADSDKESQAFMNVVPSRYTNDVGAKQKYQQMLQMIDGSVAEQKRLLGLAPRIAPSDRSGQFKVIR